MGVFLGTLDLNSACKSINLARVVEITSDQQHSQANTLVSTIKKNLSKKTAVSHGTYWILSFIVRTKTTTIIISYVWCREFFLQHTFQANTILPGKVDYSTAFNSVHFKSEAEISRTRNNRLCQLRRLSLHLGSMQ